MGNNRLTHIILYSLPVVIVLSNIELFASNSIRKALLYFLFGTLVFSYGLKSLSRFSNRFKPLLVVTFLTMLYMMLIKHLPFTEDFVMYILMDLGMLLIGAGVAVFDDKKVFERLIKIYVYISAFSCLYYRSNYDVSVVYGFELKHSMAANVIFAMWIIITKRYIFPKYMWFIVLALHIFAILNLNSRSAIVSMISGLLFLAYFKRIDIYTFCKRHKSIFLFSIVILLIIIPFVLSVLSEALRLDVLNERGAESYSADRIPMIIEGLDYYTLDYFLFGIYGESILPKEFYIECFPLEIVIKYGVFGGFFYFLWLYIVSNNIIKKGKDAILAILCLVSLFVISLFTQHAPIGPGTAYSFGWLIVGYYTHFIKPYNKNAVKN